MKKILLTAIVALFAVTAASAQDKGNWALGPRMNIYTNTGDAVVGLGAFGRYSFTDNWRIEPSLTALLMPSLLGVAMCRRAVRLPLGRRLERLSGSGFHGQ